MLLISNNIQYLSNTLSIDKCIELLDSKSELKRINISICFNVF